MSWVPDPADYCARSAQVPAAKVQVGELEGIATFAQQRAFQDRLDQLLNDHRRVIGLSDEPIASSCGGAANDSSLTRTKMQRRIAIEEPAKPCVASFSRGTLPPYCSHRNQGADFGGFYSEHTLLQGGSTPASSALAHASARSHI
jgi:hypothetical protein